MRKLVGAIKVFLFVFVLIICLCSCEESSDNLTKESNCSTEILYENQGTSSVSEYESITVYITPTGKRYHMSPTCGGKNSTPASIEDAMQIYNLTPCKKCAQ